MLYLTWTNGPAIGPIEAHNQYNNQLEIKFQNEEGLLDWQAVTGWEKRAGALLAPLTNNAITLQNTPFALTEVVIEVLSTNAAQFRNALFFGKQLGLILRLSEKQFRALARITRNNEYVAPQLQIIFA